MIEEFSISLEDLNLSLFDAIYIFIYKKLEVSVIVKVSHNFLLTYVKALEGKSYLNIWKCDTSKWSKFIIRNLLDYGF